MESNLISLQTRIWSVELWDKYASTILRIRYQFSLNQKIESKKSQTKTKEVI